MVVAVFPKGLSFSIVEELYLESSACFERLLSVAWSWITSNNSRMPLHVDGQRLIIWGVCSGIAVLCKNGPVGGQMFEAISFWPSRWYAT